jgi:hypothetical protein
MVDRTRIDIQSLEAGFSKLGAAKEPIARAMALGMGVEVRDEAIVRAPVLKPGNEGTDNQQPGTLRDAIYVAYDKRRRLLNESAYRYTVSWNSKKAPHGHLIEFGHWMPYEYNLTADGRYYTPLTVTPKRGKAKGIPLDGNGIWVSQQAFLGPAFDFKLPTLMDVAQRSGEAKFLEVMT